MFAELELSQGKRAIIDLDDLPKVAWFKWCLSSDSRGKSYAIRWERVGGKQTKIRLHRFVMGLPPRPDDGLVVHHINNDPLDNRKANLEVTTQDQNMRYAAGWKRKTEEPFL